MVRSVGLIKVKLAARMRGDSRRPIQRSRGQRLNADEGAALSEPRDLARGEFAAPPQAAVARGKPLGQVEGGLSFASFSLAGKENEGRVLGDDGVLSDKSYRITGYSYLALTAKTPQ